MLAPLSISISRCSEQEITCRGCEFNLCVRHLLDSSILVGPFQPRIIPVGVEYDKEKEVGTQTQTVSALKLSVVACILSRLWIQDLISLYQGDDSWCPGAFLQLMPTTGFFQGVNFHCLVKETCLHPLLIIYC